MQSRRSPKEGSIKRFQARVLFCHALVLVHCGDLGILLDELGIQQSSIIDVVDQSGAGTGELNERVRCDTVGVLVEGIGACLLLVAKVFVVNWQHYISISLMFVAMYYSNGRLIVFTSFWT
jgi:hypothetical protein